MTPKTKKIIFLLFFISGFCGLLYQVVWVRLAYASFGITTPVLSVVISIFMLGLSLGSWAGGRWISSLAGRFRTSSLVFYAGAEFLIGIGAFVVPRLFLRGELALLPVGEVASAKYLIFSSIIIGGTIIPWCIFMGFTVPFMMAFVKELDEDSTTGFSFLYFANVLGAMCGTLITALILIELFGFKGTLLIAAGLNFAVAIVSIGLSVRHPYRLTAENESAAERGEERGSGPPLTDRPASILLLLFFTGFASLSMEVIWIRAFTPVLNTVTYSFASLLAVYLLATWTGSYLYRRHVVRNKSVTKAKLLAGLSVAAFLPVVVNDPRLGGGAPVALLSIFPFCASLGYLTPKLIDRYSSGEPARAGRAYALNILGCIIGPLFASYLTLPHLGAKFSLVVLAVPFLFFFLFAARQPAASRKVRVAVGLTVLGLSLLSVSITVSYEEMYGLNEGAVIRRDHTATVVSAGEGRKKQLFINGFNTTCLTPITKIMAHLPLVLYRGEPENSLAICLGMGTTYRSLLSWGIEARAVELVPSVRDALGYYFEDAESFVANPKGKMIIDDGRRFLKRTDENFDVITIDPPHPVEAAGSSLLYSREFYELAEKHLNEGGILQQWFPGGEVKIVQAVARSLSDSFPYVKIYKTIEDWGYHFVASNSPIEPPSVEEAISRMPEPARADLMEWYPNDSLSKIISGILKQEIPLSEVLSADLEVVVTDDKPYNEYYVVRRAMDFLRKGQVERIR